MPTEGEEELVVSVWDEDRASQLGSGAEAREYLSRVVVTEEADMEEVEGECLTNRDHTLCKILFDAMGMHE